MEKVNFRGHAAEAWTAEQKRYFTLGWEQAQRLREPDLRAIDEAIEFVANLESAAKHPVFGGPGAEVCHGVILRKLQDVRAKYKQPKDS